MIQTYPIAKTITTLADLKQRFNLSATDNDQFFSEWQQDLPDITSQERETLDQIKRRFERHRERSPLAEGVINQCLLIDLTFFSCFYAGYCVVEGMSQEKKAIACRSQFEA
ncbi:MAG: hypothetical protein EBE86_012110 [Hormoscilla sp. GUM202]|nr:hypothetical protein [Hormoscilla sp. GUM202]